LARNDTSHGHHGGFALYGDPLFQEDRENVRRYYLASKK